MLYNFLVLDMNSYATMVSQLRILAFLIYWYRKKRLQTHFLTRWDRGGTVVKVLRYKSEGRWFDSRWCHWNFSLT